MSPPLQGSWRSSCSPVRSSVRSHGASRADHLAPVYITMIGCHVTVSSQTFSAIRKAPNSFRIVWSQLVRAFQGRRHAVLLVLWTCLNQVLMPSTSYRPLWYACKFQLMHTWLNDVVPAFVITCLGAIQLGSKTAFTDLVGSFILLTTVSYGARSIASSSVARQLTASAV